MRTKWIDILLILLGLVIIYQLIKKIIGGSWQTESIIIALLLFNIGMTWKLTINTLKVNMKFKGHIRWHKLKDKTAK